MSDLAQILLLPPPTPPPQRLPVGTAGRASHELAVNPEAQGEAQGGDNARAKRFRFRVYDGSDSSETNVDYSARRTDTRASVANRRSAEDATAQSSSGRIQYGRGDSGRGSSSTFLAQSFAQEQLGEGLHNPPYATATAAYSRTGAALNPRASAGVNFSV